MRIEAVSLHGRVWHGEDFFSGLGDDVELGEHVRAEFSVWVI